MGMSLASLQRTPKVGRIKDSASSLKEILCSVFALHEDFFESIGQEEIPGVLCLSRAENRSWRFNFKKTEPKYQYFQQICNEYFCHTVDYFYGKSKIGIDNLKALARAWACFGAGCLLLYVPNLPTDPALLPLLRKQCFVYTKDRYKQKLNDISQAEHEIFHTYDSIHCQSIQNIIDALGPIPSVRKVYRPTDARSIGLEDIYVLILELLGRFERNFLHNSDCLCDPMLLDRIQILTERLSAPGTAYHDIKNPMIAFLNCLSLGCHLASNFGSDNSDAGSASAIIQQIPLLVTSPENWRLHKDTLTLKGVQDSNRKIILSLHSISLHMNVKHFTDHPAWIKDYTLQLYNQVYHNWKTLLPNEQELEQKKTGLHHFKSKTWSDNDHNTSLDTKEIFTISDSEDFSGIENTNESSEEPSVTLADIYRGMFAEEHSVEGSLKSLINQAIKTITQDSSQRLQSSITEELNEGLNILTLLALHSVQRPERSFLAQNYTYDFTVDANLSEALKFQELLKEIQLNISNEHEEQAEEGNILEILGICRQALAIRLKNPLSIFLQLSERLYFALCNWHKLRSKALQQYTLSLAKLICSWRRLEVQSWKTVLETEDRKCSAKAKTWWFVMYESIIVGTYRACEENDLKEYQTKLIFIVEDFLLTASFGQFQQRLAMIKAFSRHLLLLAETRPIILSVYEAIANVLDYYTRYEVEIRNSTSDIRRKIAKDLSEVVHIATLKDRDVRTLRESAHASWKKILKFKLLYQDFLNQPASVSFPQHFPHVVTNTSLGISNVNVNLGPDDLHLGELAVPGWYQRKEPYKDVVSTVKLMSLMLDISSVVTECTKNVTSVRSSLQDLYQDISRRVGEEHPKLSKQSKQRKRQLFIDVKRSLRNLELGNRVGKDALNSQISTIEILAKLPILPNVDARNELVAREYFYGFLQEMPNVRRVQQEHTSNLAHYEVIQFTEYIESLLRFLTSQRKEFLIVLRSFLNVESMILKLRPYFYGETFTPQESEPTVVENSSLGGKLKILPALIALSIDVLHAQDQYYESDIEKIEASMLKWQSNFQLAYDDICNTPAIVYGLGSRTRKKLYEDIKASLLQFVQDLRDWQQLYPAFNHILDKIILWTTHSCVRSESNVSDVPNVHTISRNFFELLDSMLDSIQEVQSRIVEAGTSLDSSSWLQSVDKGALKILHAFKIGLIEQQLMRMLRQENGIKQTHEDCASCLNGLFKNFGPIIEEYRRISITFVSQYTEFHAAMCHYSYFIANTFNKMCREEFWVSNEGRAGETFSDEIRGDKVGLGDGVGAENANNDTEDSRDVTGLDHLENENNIADEIAEEDALELGEDGELEDTRDSLAEGNTVEDHLDDQEQELEEKIEQSGQSAMHEKIWDENDMEEDSEANGGQGLSTGSAAARESAESIGEPMRAHEKQELKEQAEADLTSAEAETQRMEESTILDDQEDANSTDEYDSSMQQNIVIENEDLEGASEDYSKAQSPSGSKSDESSGFNNSHLNSDNLSEASSIADIGDCDDKLSYSEDFNTDQEEENEAGSKKYGNTCAEESGGSMVKPNVVEFEINQQAGKGRGTEGFCDAYTGHKKQQSLEDDQIMKDDSNYNTYQGTDNMVNHSSSQDNSNHLLTIWKSLGSELKEWVTGKVDSAQERSAEQQNMDIDIANMEQTNGEDRFLKEQTLLKADNGFNLDAQDIEEQSQLKSISNVLDEEPHYGDKVTPERRNSVKRIPTNQESTESASKYAQETVTGKYESSSLLDKHEIDNINRNISTVKIWEYDRSHLSHFEDIEGASIDENVYQGLSHVLAEQLRLILEPTKSTKFRGDFRTGKKLNIRRIIPYIASGGKKDKIWMRRTVPSKRAYQIMLALDDSKSMVESDSISPALQSLTLISKALALVEAGELCVVAFGEDCRVALDFSAPFTYETPKLLKKSFTFTQSRTDVRTLIEATLSHFRKARLKVSFSESHLWQLQLIISDGICEEHEAIRKLLSQAEEERIMIVFIIMDLEAQASEAGQDVLQKSILNLQTATFASDAQNNIVVKRQHYMDTFPFKWYLLVRNIKDLPFILTTALRQWFAEVASYDN